MPAAKRWRPVFSHLAALTDGRGVAQSSDAPGYRLEDAAYALVVICRATPDDPVVEPLERCYLRFVVEALRPDGTFRSGKTPDGEWADCIRPGDWARGTWALGVAAAHAHSPGRRGRSLAAFRVAAGHRPSPLGAIALAGLGADAVLRSRSLEPAARSLLHDAAAAVGPTGDDPDIRLSDGGAAQAELLLVAADTERDKAARSRGLDLLAFLLRTEIRDGRLSPAGATSGAGDALLPRDVAALAGACATAYRLTSDPRWLTGINVAWRWFLGEDDGGRAMFDAATGAGYDRRPALGAAGGTSATATLAMLETAQHARRVHELR